MSEESSRLIGVDYSRLSAYWAFGRASDLDKRWIVHFFAYLNMVAARLIVCGIAR